MKALITGGTRGIGAAIAKHLLASGHDVTITGTSAKGPAISGCAYTRCDFSKLKEVEALAKKIRKETFSVLINNAGMNKIGPLEHYALADFLRVQQVNVTAPFLLCQAVIPGMRKMKFGRIVNITSIFSVVSKAGRSAYSASKFALLGLSKALALEVADDNILVNCLAPGFVETDLTRRMLGQRGMNALTPQIPLKRLAQPDEIASYVSFLVSRDNTYMTGQTILADGGFTCA